MAAWTEGMDDILRREAKAGASASQIAAQIGGVTRSAVIGRAHRLEVQIGISRVRRPRDPSAPAPAPKPKPQRPHHPGRIAIAPSPLPPAPVARPVLPVTVTRRAAGSKIRRYRAPEACPVGVGLAALTGKTCRAPLWADHGPAEGERLFCGDAVLPGSPYCPGHHARFRVPMLWVAA